MKKKRPRRPVTPQASLPPEANPQLHAAIMEVVDNQLSNGDPPETRATLERLVAQGYTPEGARQLIAHAVMHEIFAVLSEGKPYNTARYMAALARLPSISDQ